MVKPKKGTTMETLGRLTFRRQKWLKAQGSAPEARGRSSPELPALLGPTCLRNVSMTRRQVTFELAGSRNLVEKECIAGGCPSGRCRNRLCNVKSARGPSCLSTAHYRHKDGLCARDAAEMPYWRAPTTPLGSFQMFCTPYFGLSAGLAPS